ncbi:MAG: transcriptional regulator [Alphaproteobacteria bacterium]|nr:transcriptional regulator [Alphaproteobacteria bacterium]
MTQTRDAALQDFLTCLQEAFAVSAAPPQSRDFATELFSALATPTPAGTALPQQLPVLQHLPAACAMAQAAPPAVAKLASALERLAPRLAWKVRASGGPKASANWPEGHTNAVIVGSGGLEERTDVAIGASLLAPQVRYPDHTHPPEELYMILSQSRFQHGEDAWIEPGPGGTFHNAPGIKHAMASGDAPLLAVWTMIIRPDANTARS